MRVLIYDNFELQDMIYDYEKLSCGQKFRGYGAFKLLMTTFDFVETAKIGRIALVKDDAYFIEDLEKFKDLESKEKFLLKGSHINKLLERRVALKDVSVNTFETYEVQIRRIITEHFISPSNQNRKVDNMSLETLKGLSKKPTQAYILKRDSINKIINEMCADADFGYRIEYKAREKQFVFKLTESKDKTKTVFFSEKYGNATNSELKIASSAVVNVCYFDNNGTLSEYGAETGINRIERIVSGNDVGAAIEELQRSKMKESVISDILLTEQFEYEIDWDLGDIVTFVDDGVGFRVEKPILEITEMYGKQFDLEVIFGDRKLL